MLCAVTLVASISRDAAGGAWLVSAACRLPEPRLAMVMASTVRLKAGRRAKRSGLRCITWRMAKEHPLVFLYVRAMRRTFCDPHASARGSQQQRATLHLSNNHLQKWAKSAKSLVARGKTLNS